MSQTLERNSCTARSLSRPPRQAPTFRVASKIPHVHLDQLPHDFIQRLNVSLARQSLMIVGVSLKSGCVELVLDVVSSARGGGLLPSGSFRSVPLDPSLWLQHLSVQPPPGTEVLSQTGSRYMGVP